MTAGIGCSARLSSAITMPASTSAAPKPWNHSSRWSNHHQPIAAEPTGSSIAMTLTVVAGTQRMAAVSEANGTTVPNPTIHSRSRPIGTTRAPSAAGSVAGWP